MQMNSYATGNNATTGGPTGDPGTDITPTLLGLIDQRTEQLQSVQSIRSAKLRRMEMERKRLEQKLPADSPRLAALDARIADNQTMVASLGDEIYRSKTPLPTPVADAWTIFGSVRDANRKGIEGLSIVFYGTSGQRLDSLGYTCTGTDGYFRMESRDRTIDGKTPAILHVVDRDGNTLYIDAVQLVPAIGGIDYREIILDQKICAPPKDRSAVAGSTRPGATGDSGSTAEFFPTGNSGTATPGTSTPGTSTSGSSSSGPAVPDKPGSSGPATPRTPQSSGQLNWTVRGRVVDASGKPMPGLIVTLMDRDLLYDDRLGQAETNEKGEYELIYSADTFSDFLEQQPDIYVRVAERGGKQLYRSKKVLRPNAGQVEIIDIKLNK